MAVRIRYACPHCSRRITHHPDLAGQLVICSACKGEFYEPTDPLPGKSAQKALEPLPMEPRRLRTPDGMDQKHDLAILSRQGSSDLRSIEEIVEAVLIDGGAPAATPSANASFGRSDTRRTATAAHETLDAHDSIPLQPAPHGGTSGNPAAHHPSSAAAYPSRPFPGQANQPGPQPGAPKLAGPAMRPLMPKTPAQPNPMQGTSRPQLGGPSIAPSNAPSTVPLANAATKGGTPSTQRPTAPVAKPSSKPVPAPGLAGCSISQMLEELRRRGLAAALLTSDFNAKRAMNIYFSDNMTRDDALQLLQTYLDSQRDPSDKPAAKSGLLSRFWKGDDSPTE